MTQEEWKAFLPLIQAFVEGKTIQYQSAIDEEWYDQPALSDLPENYIREYRIKPEPKVIWVSFDGGSLYASVKHYPGMVKYVEVVE